MILYSFLPDKITLYHLYLYVVYAHHSTFKTETP